MVLPPSGGGNGGGSGIALKTYTITDFNMDTQSATGDFSDIVESAAKGEPVRLTLTTSDTVGVLFTGFLQVESLNPERAVASTISTSADHITVLVTIDIQPYNIHIYAARLKAET